MLWGNRIDILKFSTSLFVILLAGLIIISILALFFSQADSGTITSAFIFWR